MGAKYATVVTQHTHWFKTKAEATKHAEASAKQSDSTSHYTVVKEVARVKAEKTTSVEAVR